MTLVEFAERELREAGLFDKDSNYAGGLGEAVLELVKVFAAQGHSGGSADATLCLFCRVAAYRPLVAIKNPMLTGEYIDRAESNSGHPLLQCTRVSTVFSEDGGKRWYDIDTRVPRWKRLFGIRRAYLKFAGPALPQE